MGHPHEAFLFFKYHQVISPNAAVLPSCSVMLVCVVKRANAQTEQVLEKGKMPDKAKKYSSQQIASEILRRRYLWKDADGRVVETVDQMYQRVAQHVATAE